MKIMIVNQNHCFTVILIALSQSEKNFALLFDFLSRLLYCIWQLAECEETMRRLKAELGTSKEENQRAYHDVSVCLLYDVFRIVGLEIICVVFSPYLLMVAMRTGHGVILALASSRSGTGQNL